MEQFPKQTNPFVHAGTATNCCGVLRRSATAMLEVCGVGSG